MMCRHPQCQRADNPRETWGGTALCGLHVRGLQADLEDIARVVTLIEADPWALSSPGGGSDGASAGKPGSRPPMRLGVLDVVTGVTAAAITGWAADIVRTDRVMGLAESARVLVAHRDSDAVLSHPVVDQLAVEVRDAAAACRAVVPDDRWNTADDDRRPRVVGRCSEGVVDGGECGGNLMWVTATLVVKCQRCHAEQVPDGWVHKRVVLRAFGLSRSTLNAWITRGHVTATDSGSVCVDDVRSMVRRLRKVKA